MAYFFAFWMASACDELSFGSWNGLLQGLNTRLAFSTAGLQCQGTYRNHPSTTRIGASTFSGDSAGPFSFVFSKTHTPVLIFIYLFFV